MLRRHATGAQPLLQPVRQGQVVQVPRRYVHRQPAYAGCRAPPVAGRNPPRRRQPTRSVHRWWACRPRPTAGTRRVAAAPSPPVVPADQRLQLLQHVRPARHDQVGTPAPAHRRRPPAAAARSTANWPVDRTRSSNCSRSTTRSGFFQHPLDRQPEALAQRAGSAEHPCVEAAHQHQRAGGSAGPPAVPQLLHAIRRRRVRRSSRTRCGGLAVTQGFVERLGVGDRERLHA